MYVNIFVIVFCDIDFFIEYVDVVIFINNKGCYFIGFVWWMFVCEVFCFCGIIYNCEVFWDVMVDFYFCMYIFIFVVERIRINLVL